MANVDEPVSGEAAELPMFPLGSVLLPGMILPLHVFEPRFRVLVDTVLLSDSKEFGVVLIERGSEVGGGDTRTVVGCVAGVTEVARAPDGRVGLTAVGLRRLRVEEWLEDDPYPRALVRDWPDDPRDGDAGEPDGDVESALDEVVVTLARLNTMAARLGLADGSALPELSSDPHQRVYQAATISPLGALDRQRLLAARDLGTRVTLLRELLGEQEILLQAEIDRREG